MIFVLLNILLILFLFLSIHEYKKTSYYKNTNNSFGEVHSDKGKLGEYLIYKLLNSYEEKGNKFLFNLYIPTLEGKTTEIDLLMITKKGIFTFESKNYSGWIFGNEKSRMWMQTLPSGRERSRKNQFFNPIFQNELHIEKLKKVLENFNDDVVLPFFSIITFSERCTLKQVPENTRYIKIIKRNNLVDTVQKIYDINPDIIEQEKVVEIYNQLYQYTQVNEKIKQDHIENIKNNH